MTSVERIAQYTKLEQEAPAHTGSDEPLPEQWPQAGQITFDHVMVSYFKDDNYALNDICITIQAGEKIGVVGRTGAGKSSFIGSLLRLIEPTGSIWIDGVDITRIGLNDLRKNISVIPQDPILFTGSWRHNLDPFEEYNDEQLWEAIEKVQLKGKVDELPGQLYAHVAEAGSNFSVGQKQLLCLARALLRQNKILLLDEATANVDMSTDEQIQKTIEAEFKDCTVVTVAHRLKTVVNADRILVLDGGRVKEFDHPYILMQDSSGLFHEMVQQTGTANAEMLMKCARRSYKERVNRQERE